MEGSSPYLTLGCTLSSVSSPPAGPQTPQCRHNVEQSLVFQVVSGIWLKGKHTFPSSYSESKEGFQGNFCSRYLHVGSCHAAKLLLKNGQHAPQCGGESLWIQHADGAAPLGKWRYDEDY